MIVELVPRYYGNLPPVDDETVLCLDLDDFWNDGETDIVAAVNWVEKILKPPALPNNLSLLNVGPGSPLDSATQAALVCIVLLGPESGGPDEGQITQLLASGAIYDTKPPIYKGLDKIGKITELEKKWQGQSSTEPNAQPEEPDAQPAAEWENGRPEPYEPEQLLSVDTPDDTNSPDAYRDPPFQLTKTDFERYVLNSDAFNP